MSSIEIKPLDWKRIFCLEIAADLQQADTAYPVFKCGYFEEKQVG